MVIDRENNVLNVKLPRRCEGSSAKDMHGILADDENKKVSSVVFDFTDTIFIDSSSIGMLVTIDRFYKEKKVPIILKHLNEEINELFVDTGLDLLFAIETEEGLNEASIDLFEESVDIKLEIEKEEKNDVCLFHLSGVMNHPVGSRYFKQQILLAIADFKKILLDFENLTFFDSLSVSVVLSMHKLLRETGGSIRFCCANYIVNDLFTTLNIDQIIPTYDTIEGALADWE